MKIALPIKSFSFYKTLFGSLFLVFSLFSPTVAAFSFLLALVVGRAHSIGAWVAMWRSSRLSWRYVLSMFVLMVAVSYVGFQVWDFKTLSFFTYLLFAFHFIFDEFTVSGEESDTSAASFLSSVNALALLSFFLLRDFYFPEIPLAVVFIFCGMLLLIEIFYTKEVGWFFIQNKVLLFFIISSYLLNFKAGAILAVLLIFHYLFWFAYPVYKLHKYKREERDGFVMLLIIIVGTSFYFAVTKSSFSPIVLELATKSFLIGTIVHILSTAPFAPLFGLKPSKVPVNK